MKNNLGKVFLIIFILFSYINILDAKEVEYKWSAFINKKSAFVNEAIYLKYICEFEDRAELYVVEFTPRSTDKYEIKSLSQTQRVRNGKKIQVYEYIVFAKVSGKLDFDFEVKMKKTNKDSIVNGILGRDNLQFEEFTTTIIKQKKLSINIDAASEELIGAFELEVKKDEPKLKAYEPYHLSITINGIGNFYALSSLDYSGVNAKVFESAPKNEYILTKKGYSGQWSQKFAFVSEKNFSIPEMEIEYFDEFDGKIKILKVDAINVEVSSAYTQEELLDEVDDTSIIFKKEYLYYLLTFIAGFLLAKVRFSIFFKDIEDENSIDSKIRKTKTLEELHMLLILQNDARYKQIILEIESKKLDSISKIKKELKI